jgi:hypothetical protein
VIVGVTEDADQGDTTTSRDPLIDADARPPDCRRRMPDAETSRLRVTLPCAYIAAQQNKDIRGRAMCVCVEGFANT